MTALEFYPTRPFTALLLAVVLLAGCAEETIIDPPPPVDRSMIQGVVADEDGHTFPGVIVTLRHEGDEEDLRSAVTDVEGSFRFASLAAGDYLVAVGQPSSSEIVEANPAAVALTEGANARADFTVRILPVEGQVTVEQGPRENYIGTASGEMPVSPDEPLYHANEPEELHAIIAPDGHHVTLAEWRQAAGTARVTCAGAAGTRFELTLEGLIPDGVYSVGAVLVNWIDGAPVRAGTGALGASNGSQNVFTASSLGEGTLQATAPPGAMSRNGSAPDCMLTQVQEVALWVTYHLDPQQPSMDRAPNRTWVLQLRFKFGRDG